MGRRVLLVRHGDEPADDRVVTWLTQAGFEIDSRKPFAGDSLGEPDEDLAGTVIYGGLFNVYETEKHSFLKEEYRWIDACLKADVPMLGICQGAQQIAYHLGAWAGPRAVETFEFGYYRIDPTPAAAGFLDAPIWVTQAHYHTFDLPEGAVRLASNDNYENQAYRYGDKVYGFQFHPEVTIEGFRRWQESKSAVYSRPGAQTREEQDRAMYKHDAAQAKWFYEFFGTLFGDAA
ncbi:glutamine amidotransferase [Rhodobacterales bacterium 56_14_T64]|nr:glutamine amidotransferase [Rhodobacterales bacterium 56_14_T64]